MERLILCGFPKLEDAPSTSGFCVKLEAYLRVAHIPYKHQKTYNFSAPKKKLPYIIRQDGSKLADSHFIIRWICAQDPSKDLNATLSIDQIATSRAWQTWIEELVYSAVVWDRWHEHPEKTEEENLGSLPWIGRKMLGFYFRRLIMNALWTTGIGRHDRDEVLALMKEFVDSVALRYTNNHNYFHGTEIDVIVFAFLLNAISLEGNKNFNSLWIAKPGLVRFVTKMTKKWFSEYTKVIAKLESISLFPAT
jgi:glutathione S-transferase